MNINKTDRILIIVESPNKTKTITDILKKAGYTNARVLASKGHIQQLADDANSWKNSGIWPDEDFRLNLRIAEDKHKTVSELTAAAQNADYIYLMSDGDREGHVIAWSLIQFLHLDTNKCYRAITHEITPKAVVAALENPIPFDTNMVNAGLSRLTLDKLIGYGLSPIARTYIGAKSVGRCQSAGLLLITNREKEIQDFKPETYYDLYLNFTKNKTKFKAKYVGDAKHTVDHLKTKAELDAVMNACIDDFKIIDIVKREKLENPKPPFSTPTFQQEAASKLGLSVKAAQSCAQKLFEGIEVNHQHIGLVTYIRTDATDMSPEFIPELKKYIVNTYGSEAFRTPKVGKKSENAQEGHEALRCVDPTMTPDKLASYISDELLIKVYRLIWQRTIAAAMPPATISETTYLINNNGNYFSLVSNELVSPGFKAVYSYTEEDAEKEITVKDTFKVNEVLKQCKLDGQEKATRPPARYKEATFIKALEKSEIGRPSTYATILENILNEKRGYCKLENKEIVPTQLGMHLSEYLTRAFPNIISLTYTKEMEKDLDLVAEGKLTKSELLNTFFTNLTESISKNTEGQQNLTDQICPLCGAPMILRRNKWGKLFYGCSKYPTCHGITNVK